MISDYYQLTFLDTESENEMEGDGPIFLQGDEESSVCKSCFQKY